MLSAVTSLKQAWLLEKQPNAAYTSSSQTSAPWDAPLWPRQVRGPSAPYRWWVCHWAPPGGRAAPRRRRSRSAAAPGGARRPRRHRALPGAPWPRLRARPTAPGTARLGARHGAARLRARLPAGLGWAGCPPCARSRRPALRGSLGNAVPAAGPAPPQAAPAAAPVPANATLVSVTGEAGSTRKGLLIKTYVNTEKKTLKIVHYIVLTVSSKLYLYRLTGTLFFFRGTPDVYKE